MKKIKTILLLLLVVLSLAACQKKDDKVTDGEKIVVRANVSQQWFYAQEKGIIDQYFPDNVELVLNQVQSGPVSNEAFGANSLEFTMMASLPAISGCSNGYGTVDLAISSSSKYTGVVVVPADSSITKVEELKGKRIGTYVGGSWYLATSKYLENVGLTLDDVEILNTAAETATGIRTGELDAGVMSIITAKQLESEGSGKIIADDCGLPEYNIVVGRKAFVDQYPEIAQAFLKAEDEILKYVLENLEDYYAFYEKQTGTSAETLRKTYTLYDYGVRTFGAEEKTVMASIVQWMKDTGLLVNTSFNPEDLYSLSAVETLKK